MITTRSFKSLSPTPDTVPFGPPRSPVRILGSGLSALTLGISLYRKGIPFKVYTKDRRPQENSHRQKYSLLLHANIIRGLWRLLRISKEEFQYCLMVPNTNPFPPDGPSVFVARVHRGRLERLLMREFEEEVEWGCEIKAGVMGSPPLVFPSHVKGIGSQGDLTFDCMGVHSPIKCAEGRHEIEPFVVFRGSTCFAKPLWNQKFRDWFRGHAAQIKQRFGGTVLELSVNNINSKNDAVSLTYIYSRHHTGPLDELWVPKRSNDEASSPFLIGKFLDEIKTFRLKYKLPEPYDEIFDPDRMKKDKIVHWLMRTNLTEQSKLIHIWNGEKIYKLGDAAHYMPIVESTGAELAIRDGIEAAEQVGENGGAMLHRWLIARWPMKMAHVEAGRRNLYRRHSKED